MIKLKIKTVSFCETCVCDLTNTTEQKQKLCLPL